jgi:hypothetical protein
MKYVIVRSYVMGVFAGELQEERTDTKLVLKNARRLWYWSGASSLSELAVKGTATPNECKFPCEVPQVELNSPQGFEILDVTEQAQESIKKVPIWTQHKE